MSLKNHIRSNDRFGFNPNSNNCFGLNPDIAC